VPALHLMSAHLMSAHMPCSYVCTHALLLMCAHKSKHTSCKIGKL